MMQQKIVESPSNFISEQQRTRSQTNLNPCLSQNGYSVIDRGAYCGVRGRQEAGGGHTHRRGGRQTGQAPGRWCSLDTSGTGAKPQ